MSSPETTPDPGAETEAAPADPRTPIALSYAAESRVEARGGDEAVSLIGNQQRDPVRLNAKIKEPIRLREALSALYSIVASDFRYVPRDRTAYLAFKTALADLEQRPELAGNGVAALRARLVGGRPAAVPGRAARPTRRSSP